MKQGVRLPSHRSSDYGALIFSETCPDCGNPDQASLDGRTAGQERRNPCHERRPIQNMYYCLGFVMFSCEAQVIGYNCISWRNPTINDP